MLVEANQDLLLKEPHSPDENSIFDRMMVFVGNIRRNANYQHKVEEYLEQGKPEYETFLLDGLFRGALAVQTIRIMQTGESRDNILKLLDNEQIPRELVDQLIMAKIPVEKVVLGELTNGREVQISPPTFLPSVLESIKKNEIEKTKRFFPSDADSSQVIVAEEIAQAVGDGIELVKNELQKGLKLQQLSNLILNRNT